MQMNMKDYPTLHFIFQTQIKVKEQCYYCCSTFQSQRCFQQWPQLINLLFPI